MAATSEVGGAPFILANSQRWKAETTFVTIYTNQLTMFHNSFDGNTTHKTQLEVCVICAQKVCKVDFRSTSDETENENLLSTLYVTLPSPSIDRQVSNLFKLFSKTGRTEFSTTRQKNNSRSCRVDCLANRYPLPSPFSHW